LLNRDARAKLLEAVTLVLVHSDGEVLQHWRHGVCSMSNSEADR
jgi:hypothetical protein